MPTADQHRRKADKNRQFLDTVPVEVHPEWAVTVAFYVAVHRVEFLRAVLGDGHSRDHAGRLDYVGTVHPALNRPFEQLYLASRRARYESASDFFAYFDTDGVRDRVIGGWLAAVEAYVADQTAAPPEAAP